MSFQTEKAKPTAVVEWKQARASDNSQISPQVSCNLQSGTNFNIGRTNVTCEAVDGSGNRAECSFQVDVIGKYSCTVCILMLLNICKLILVTNLATCK